MIISKALFLTSVFLLKEHSSTLEIIIYPISIYLFKVNNGNTKTI